MDNFLAAAHAEAEASLAEGGFPVGAVIVKEGAIIGAGRNRYSQTGDPTTHAELEAMRAAAAGAGSADPLSALRDSTCYTTMMPCEMCTGAMIRFGLTKVVVAEITSYHPADTRGLLEARGIEVEIRASAPCIETVERYFAKYPSARASTRPSDHRGHPA